MDSSSRAPSLTRQCQAETVAPRYTAGPWEVREKDGDRDILPGTTFYVAVITRANDLSGLDHLKMVDGDYHVCKFNPTKDERAARMMASDARLIASAPDLLTALKDVVSAFAMNNAEPEEMVAALRQPIITAAAAISKAEARS